VIEENDIIEKYNISEPVRTRSRKLLLGASSVDYDSRTSVLTVSYQDIDPVFARDMANSIVEELQEWFRSRGGLTRMEELRSLENKIAEVEGEIARLESEIQAFQREHGVLNVEEIAQTQSNMLADLQSQLVDLEVQIRNQETFSRIDDDPALARLRAQRDNVIELIDQIEQGYTGGARTMPARNQLPELALEFRRLQTDLEIQQRIYQAVSEQYEVVRLTAEAGPAFTVLELAEIPEEKAGPSRGQLSMKVTIFAFAASVALAYLIHFARVLWSDHETRRIIGETLGWGRKRDSSRDA
jgi:capsule polysaccharide export protein KpsE/RkpR